MNMEFSNYDNKINRNATGLLCPIFKDNFCAFSDAQPHRCDVYGTEILKMPPAGTAFIKCTIPRFIMDIGQSLKWGTET